MIGPYSEIFHGNLAVTSENVERFIVTFYTSVKEYKLMEKTCRRRAAENNKTIEEEMEKMCKEMKGIPEKPSEEEIRKAKEAARAAEETRAVRQGVAAMGLGSGTEDEYEY